MAQIAANSVHLVKGGNIIKQGDETPFTFQLSDETGQTVDLTGATAKIRLANRRILVLEKDAVVNEDNTITFNIDADDATGNGEMRLEIIVTHSDSMVEVFPARGYQEILITPSLGDLDSGFVAEITIEEFERRVNAAVGRADVAADNAIQSVEGVGEAIEGANAAADNANTAGQYASEQGDYAKAQGDYASAKADEFDASEAERVSAESQRQANESSRIVAEAGRVTNEQSRESAESVREQQESDRQANTSDAIANANTQADYARTQGDYAKAQGELIDDILADGSVASVNGKTGNVVLDASDVNAIPSSDKGIADGVARLNAEGKVVDAEGNEVEGKVTSVNGQTGDVQISVPTKNSELENDSDFATKGYVDGKEVDLSGLTTKQEFDAHLADDMQHGRFTINGIKYQGYWTPNEDFSGLKFVYNEVTN